MEGTYPSLREFKDSQEETDPVLRNIDANMLQRLNDDRDKSAQRARELEGSLGIALQAIQRLEARMQKNEASKPREEPKKAPMILMEDNLTKAKRALMAPKQLCPTGVNVHAIESKANPREEDVEKLTKLREVLIKKSREYCTSFPKYSVELKKGQAWCAIICYNARYYRADTIAAGVVKFAIYGAIDDNMKTRILHLEPRNIGFDSFTPAEYLEEILQVHECNENGRSQGGV